MAKPMTAFTTDLQHSGMIAKDLDETIKFYREVMGFELAGLFMNGENRCAFLRYGHLTIETWEGDPAPMTTGAINHWAFDTPDIEAAFENAKALGVDFKDTRNIMIVATTLILCLGMSSGIQIGSVTISSLFVAVIVSVLLNIVLPKPVKRDAAVKG